MQECEFEFLCPPFGGLFHIEVLQPVLTEVGAWLGSLDVFLGKLLDAIVVINRLLLEMEKMVRRWRSWRKTLKGTGRSSSRRR